MLQFQRHFLHMKHTGSENDRIIDKTRQKRQHIFWYIRIYFMVYIRRDIPEGRKSMEKTLNNNQVIVAGEIASDFTFSHEIFGEGFYMVDLVVARLSDTYDVIPLMVSDRLFDVENSHIGEKVVARGQFRSYNKHEETRNRLILSVFVREISVLDDEEDEAENKPNQIYLDGYICKEPVYRMTPLGREIADILLAVNRAYGKSDYIPCICWGRNARFAGKLKVGEHVAVWGRIQSREYQKRIGNDQIISKTAYEVSVSKMECLE